MKLRTLRAPQWVQLTAGDPARFQLKPLTGEERMELSQQVWLSPRVLQMPVGDMFRAVRRSLIGWEGIVDDESGEPVPFSTEAIDLLPEGTIAVLVQQVHSLSTLHRVIPPPAEDEDGRHDPDEVDAFLEEDEPGNSDSQ